MWASFTYFTPLLLAPSFIVFSGSRKKQLTATAALAVLAGLFALPMALLGFDPFATRPLSTGGPTNPYWVVTALLSWTYQKVTIPFGTELVLLAGLIAIAVLLPLFSRSLRLDLTRCLLIVLSATFVVAANYIQTDNFVILVFLIPLAVAFLGGNRVSYAKILELELFLVPLLWIVQMFNGPGLVSGVYYWAFFVLHQDVALFQPLGGTVAWKLCVLLYATFLLLAVEWVVHEGRMRSARSVPGVSRPTAQPQPRQPSRPEDRSARALVTLACCVAVVLVPVGGAIATQSGSQITSVQGFPSQLFQVHDYASGSAHVYLLPSPSTFVYSPGSPRVTIFPESPPVGFVRYLAGQSFYIDGSLAPQPLSALAVGQYASVMNASGSIVAFASTVRLPASAVPLAPVQASNVSAVSGPNPVISGLDRIYSSNGSGIRTYSLNASALNGTSTVFAAQMTQYSRSQQLLWDISVGGKTLYESFLVGQSFYFGYFQNGTWHLNTRSTPVILGTWFYSGFSIGETNGSITAWIDGTSMTLAHVWNATGVIYLYFGKFGPSPSNDGRFALIGNFTDLYTVPTTSLGQEDQAFVLPADGGPLLALPSGDEANVTYSGGPASGVLEIDGLRLGVQNPAQVVQIGKLSQVPLFVNITFNRITLASGGGSIRLLWEALEATVSLPAIPMIFLWYGRPVRRPLPCLAG